MKKQSLQPIAPESYAETSRWLWVQSWNNSLYLAWLIPKALFKSVSGSKTSCATKESTLKRDMKKQSLQPIAPESYAETSRWLWVQSWNNSLYLAWLIPKALFKSVSGSKTSCATKESTLEKEHEETVSATHSTRKLCWNFTVTLGAILKQLTLPSLIDTEGFVQICFR